MNYSLKEQVILANIFLRSAGQYSNVQILHKDSDFYDKLKSNKFSVPDWKFSPFLQDNKLFIEQTGIVNSINACYHQPVNGVLTRWGGYVENDSRPFTGAFAMFYIIKKMSESVNGKDAVLDLERDFASVLEKLSVKEFASWVIPENGFCNLPLIKKRVEHLNEVGSVLNESYNGRFVDLINSANKDLLRISSTLVEDFPVSYGQDRHNSKYGNLVFDKRANLFALQVYGRSPDSYSNIENLGAVPDYRVPMALESLGLLKFSDCLKNKINSGKRIGSGTLTELGFRAATVICLEELIETFGVNMAQADYFLWNAGRKIENAPFVVTMNY